LRFSRGPRSAELRHDEDFQEAYRLAGQTMARYLLGLRIATTLALAILKGPLGTRRKAPDLLVLDELKRVVMSFLMGIIVMRNLSGDPM
jgi:hypothetical protein